MKKEFVCSFFIFVLTTPLLTMAQSKTCAELINYRDKSLIVDLEKASKKLTMAQDSLSLLKKVQLETQKVANSTPTVNKVFQLVLSIQTVNNAIANILKINPQTGVIMEGAGKANKWVANIMNASSATGVVSAISSSSVENYLFWEAVGDINPIGSGIKAIYELGQNVKEQKEEYDDGQELIETLESQLKTLERSLRKAQERVTQQSNIIRSINEFKNQIDSKCNKG